MDDWDALIPVLEFLRRQAHEFLKLSLEMRLVGIGEFRYIMYVIEIWVVYDVVYRVLEADDPAKRFGTQIDACVKQTANLAFRITHILRQFGYGDVSLALIDAVDNVMNHRADKRMRDGRRKHTEKQLYLFGKGRDLPKPFNKESDAQIRARKKYLVVRDLSKRKIIKL
jgi:hypothetical protein